MFCSQEISRRQGMVLDSIIPLVSSHRIDYTHICCMNGLIIYSSNQTHTYMYISAIKRHTSTWTCWKERYLCFRVVWGKHKVAENWGHQWEFFVFCLWQCVTPGLEEQHPGPPGWEDMLREVGEITTMMWMPQQSTPIDWSRWVAMLVFM